MGEILEPTVKLTESKPQHKVKRGKRKSKKNKVVKTMNILGNNAAGILNKLDSFERNISKFQPGVFFVQESKCARKNKVKHPDYVMFEHVRKHSAGGGLLTAVHKNLKPVSVSEETDIEILVVQGVVNNKAVRFINGYGPQDESNSTDNEKQEFFNRLDEEVKSSGIAGAMICIQMDANSKLGTDYIPGDPKSQSKNGKLLAKVIDENDLVVVNGTDKCSGLITRHRETINGVEESVIDFFIVCRRFFHIINSLVIDEKRIYCLTKFSTNTGKRSIKETDHNMFILNMNISWDTSYEEKDERTEIFNYRSDEDFETFIMMTTENLELRTCFDNDEEDINVACNRWISILNSLIIKSFKKIRIKKNKAKDPKLESLFEKKEQLKTYLVVNENTDEDEYDDKKSELENVLEDIASLCAQKNKDIIDEHLGNIDDGMEGFNQAKTWALKKKLSPKNTEEPPMAKKDNNGTLITDKKALEKLYMDTYKERLKPNKIAPGCENLELLKEYLYKLRYESCKSKKTEKWVMDDLDNVLKSMKNNKARDAHGHVYELFKYGGDDLKESLLKMFNLVKDKQIYPEIFKPANITSLYKNRGEKSDLNNDRGVFNVVKIRSLLDKLIYNDKSSIVDNNMSSSNIGGRKKRNIRDHLFVVNAILHDVKNNKENIDIGLFDVIKCFDKLWSSETANDFFEAGVKDDKFVLVAKSNESCKIAVKTPWGSVTPRVEFTNIEMQGGVLTPLKCSVQLDTLGLECLSSVEHSKLLYKYKGFVPIPPLAFVDDVMTITTCSTNTLKMNALVQSKVECKKLELSDKKCVKLHVGKNVSNCPNLVLNNKNMKTSSSEKYLGDVISSSGKIDENVQMRHDKGLGIVNSILSILKEITFGQFYFEVAMMLRTSLLVNGMLFNLEAIGNISSNNINILEDCDKKLMRRIFESEQGTPIESFYLETSAWPFRFILMGRQLMYYWTILNKPESELVRQVFNAQRDFPSKGSWIDEVQGVLKNVALKIQKKK